MDSGSIWTLGLGFDIDLPNYQCTTAGIKTYLQTVVHGTYNNYSHCSCLGDLDFDIWVHIASWGI